MIETLRYEPATHSYFAVSPSGNGGANKERWIPGVTRVLADCGYNKGARFFTQESRQRGTALHYAVALVDLLAPRATVLDEVLEVADIDIRLQPYVSGYLLWKRETGFVMLHSEFAVWSSALQVAGTVDLYGTYPDGRRVLADLKSWKSQGAKPKRSAEIQTAGYSLLARESHGLQTDVRIILKLPGDGKYRAYEAPGHQRDEAIFRSCCTVWHDRYANGLVEGVSRESEVDLEDDAA